MIRLRRGDASVIVTIGLSQSAAERLADHIADVVGGCRRAAGEVWHERHDVLRFDATKAERFVLMEAECANFEVTRMGRLLEVSASGYYRTN